MPNQRPNITIMPDGDNRYIVWVGSTRAFMTKEELLFLAKLIGAVVK